MERTENFPWIPFYTRFADALVPYRHDRKGLIEKLRNAYSSIRKEFPTLEDGSEYEDIDPFTVFELFNNKFNPGKDFKSDARSRIIGALMKEFGVDGEIPEEFPGIAFSTGNPRKGKDAGEIENLWTLFLRARDLAGDDTPQNRKAFCVAFDKVRTTHWSLTGGLFSMRPSAFLNLNPSNHAFLEKHFKQFLEKIDVTLSRKKQVPAGSAYLSLRDAFREDFASGNSACSSFPDLSLKASLYATEQRVARKEPRAGSHRQPQPPVPQTSEGTYRREDFLNEAFLEAARYDALTQALEYKQNLILQGPPGVGKTFVAKRLAYAWAGRKDTERVKLVQFHQNTSYEDFIMGFRPIKGGGFDLKPGMFYEFCKEAEKDGAHRYCLIIDEINRGNTSKIFGDMFMLLEKDKRGAENAIPLLYDSRQKFSIPENLYIIGTMNTADRSLAMLDYALRRRFAFYDLKPAFDTRKFAEYAEGLENPDFHALIRAVKALNNAIRQDPALGEGFCIGHSYFSNFAPKEPAGKLRAIVRHELIPLIKEYWYDDPKKAREWSDQLDQLCDAIK